MHAADDITDPDLEKHGLANVGCITIAGHIARFVNKEAYSYIRSSHIWSYPFNLKREVTMTRDKMLKKAKDLGLKNPSGMKKEELIRNIQKAEGNAPCFSTGKKTCSETTCCWRGDCIS